MFLPHVLQYKCSTAIIFHSTDFYSKLFTHQLRSPSKYEKIHGAVTLLREMELLQNGEWRELEEVTGGTHPSLDKEARETEAIKRS